MAEFVLKAEPRTEFGTRNARRLRQKGRIPGNLYGHGTENLLVSVDAREFSKLMEAGHRILSIQMGPKRERSVVKEIQYDALGTGIVHVDFSRIRSDEKIEVLVPIETVGVPKGVTSGGVLSFQVQSVTVSALPDDLPEKYRLNIEGLEIGQMLRLKDLVPPPQCAFLGDPDTVVVAVVEKREEVVAAPVEVAPTQPEVIGEKKEEEAEEPPPAEAKKKEKES